MQELKLYKVQYNGKDYISDKGITDVIEGLQEDIEKLQKENTRIKKEKFDSVAVTIASNLMKKGYISSGKNSLDPGKEEALYSDLCEYIVEVLETNINFFYDRL